MTVVELLSWSGRLTLLVGEEICENTKDVTNRLGPPPRVPKACPVFLLFWFPIFIDCGCCCEMLVMWGLSGLPDLYVMYLMLFMKTFQDFIQWRGCPQPSVWNTVSSTPKVTKSNFQQSKSYKYFLKEATPNLPHRTTLMHSISTPVNFITLMMAYCKELKLCLLTNWLE